MNEFDAALDSVLRRVIPGCTRMLTCERLSGGANQETYRIRAETRSGTVTLCLRRAAGGTHSHVPGLPGLAVEARLFRAAAAVGVPEPEVYHVLEATDGVGEGFIMQWLDGEALGAHIARGEEFAGIRDQLAFQCGQMLARIHRIDVDSTGLRSALTERDTGTIIQTSRELYQSYGTPQPMIDYAARWLLDHLPQRVDPTLVHGDFRNGNIMMDPKRGIVAVLDWEGAHIGDPMRDLGWLCTNSWRFGVTEKTAGGFGELNDLIAGYETESGAAVDRDRVNFWIVYGSYNWAIGCLTMAHHYRTGPDATVERPGIGRRSSECQVDCANLLIPGSTDLPQPSATAANLDMPTDAELLTSVRDFLRGDVMSSTDGRTRFLARVAGNSLDILLREATLGSVYRAGERRLLMGLLGREGDLFTLRQLLCERLRSGLALDTPQLAETLRYITLTQALIDQPGYSGVKTALAAR
ncbi:MAG: phosphotransferase family protein [Gammaproteobacteria bacterium]|nr:phosphotransferase family protein [Gammaproteobacteria bacterium]